MGDGAMDTRGGWGDGVLTHPSIPYSCHPPSPIPDPPIPPSSIPHHAIPHPACYSCSTV